MAECFRGGGSGPPALAPLWNSMQFAPTTHFVVLSQAILCRGAAIGVVWKPFLAPLGIGVTLLFISLPRFRKTISQMV
jgi:ABC-2 type transport system permease protein